jgi:TetR/AcrR family fatty acid metabolism transcriptional regulator
MSSKILTTDQTRPSFIEAARRAQIIECAIDTIAELGFAHASLAQIAKRASVSTSVISYYFAGKDELLRAVAAHVVAAGEAFIRPRLDLQSGARAALRSLVAAFVGNFAARPNSVIAIRNIIFAGRGDLWYPNYPATESRARAAFVRILEWGQRDGVFRPFDVRIVAGIISAILDSIVGRVAADPAFDIDATCREVLEVVDRATRAEPR